MAETTSFSSSLIVVNNAAPKHAMGKVNGTGQMLASFVRAVGPALAGVLWGGSMQLSFFGHQFLPFAFFTSRGSGNPIYVRSVKVGDLSSCTAYTGMLWCEYQC